MSAVTAEPLTPRLAQSVRWGEHYVSCALNAKFAGIIKPGIYRGFVLKPAGVMSVRVENGDACRSVAVVERDGYSITVVMLDGGEIKIPMRGTWYICIEALYVPSQPGHQRIVACENVEPHHVVIGRVEVTEIGVEITSDMIFSEDRDQSEIPSREDIDDLWDAIHALMDNGDGSTLPEKWDSLKKLSTTLGRIEETVDTFFNSSGDGDEGSGLESIKQAILELKNGLTALGERKQQAWLVEAPVEEGGILSLPITYLPGTGALLLHWDGVPLTPGFNFEEQGISDQPSSSVKLLFSAPAGSEFHAIVLGGTWASSGGPHFDPITGTYRGPVAVGTSISDMKDSGLLILASEG